MYDSMLFSFFFFFKQKTADEMRISDWSSDVCSSDLAFLQYRNKGIWRDQAPRRVIPSDQCFSRDDMIGMETVFGLIDYPNVPGGEGSVQFTCDRQTPIAFPVEFIAIPFPTLAARHGTIADRKSTSLNSSH